jgi:tRNA(fMet)-specific endonuclease VapC
VDGYLIETTILSDWIARDTAVIDHVQRLPEESPIYLSVVTLGEIEYGYIRISETADEKREEFDRFLLEMAPIPVVLDVTRHDARRWAEVRVRLFDKFAPKKKRTAGLRVSQLRDPCTDLELGIQENDLWIAGQAVERNLVLVTRDKMNCIREVCPELRVENWSSPIETGEPAD